MPDSYEKDWFTSAESDEEHDKSEIEENDSENESDDDASIASYDSDFPDEYIIHDHEATRTGKYSTIHGFQRA